MLQFESLPSISVIAPAYNEARTIVQNVKGLLKLNYQDFEIIVVNDGSLDNSLEILIESFGLIKSNQHYDMRITTKHLRGIYKSRNKAYNHLTIIDKENGGKADALNAGINLSKNDLFLSIDVDCILEPEALLYMVKPFVENVKSECIAVGGVIRIANSCEIENGQITKVQFPSNFLAQIQVFEYYRAFILGRMAWSRMNALLIISGAFGLFNRQKAMAVGGYDTSTVGEDLELVIRMRRYMHDVVKKKYSVSFVPDPLCWTEVPELFTILSRQRNRWTRGCIESIFKHKNMIFNPKYGSIGLLSFPYWVFFEWLAPLIQLLGVGYVIFLTIFGMLSIQYFLILLTFVISFALMYSFFAVYYESITYNKYSGVSYLAKSFFVALIEIIFYQPMNVFFALTGNFDIFLRSKTKIGWGEMTRKGFQQKST